MSRAAPRSVMGRADRHRAAVWTRWSARGAVSIGLVAAAVVGAHLGQSAISEINPIHFQGPLERPRGVDPEAAPPVQDEFAQVYDWGRDEATRVADCGQDCDAPQVRQAMRLAFAAPTAPDAPAPYWRDVTPTTELQPWRPGALPYRGLSVERYLHYPVDRTQDPAPPPAAPETPPMPAPSVPTESVANQQ